MMGRLGERERQRETKPAVLEYRLSLYDWQVVEILVKLLRPFEFATKQFQGSGIPGTRSICGSFDEYFPVMWVLLSSILLRSVHTWAQ